MKKLTFDAKRAKECSHCNSNEENVTWNVMYNTIDCAHEKENSKMLRIPHCAALVYIVYSISRWRLICVFYPHLSPIINKCIGRCQPIRRCLWKHWAKQKKPNPLGIHIKWRERRIKKREPNSTPQIYTHTHTESNWMSVWHLMYMALICNLFMG